MKKGIIGKTQSIDKSVKMLISVNVKKVIIFLKVCHESTKRDKEHCMRDIRHNFYETPHSYVDH